MKHFLSLKFLIQLLGMWLAISTLVLTLVALLGAPPNTRAVLLMGTALIIIWVAVGGLSMYLVRHTIRRLVINHQFRWQIKFLLFAGGLALIEEAITTTLTNLAPWFGVPIGSAYITASTNYMDVVCLHSVVVFIPMFFGWVLLLQRYSFSPNAVFLLFGLNGVLSETIMAGIQVLTQFAFWIFVYGLMVYLPAYTLPEERGAVKPRLQHYLLAMVFPILCSLPVALLIQFIHPVPTHFLPILPGT